MREDVGERYRMYVDESGDHSYNMLYQDSNRYLSLLGVWFNDKDYLIFSERLETIKNNIFGKKPDSPIILHREDIIHRKGPFVILKDQQKNSLFEESLLALIKESSFMLCCVIIDKKRHKENYKTPAHPYHYCMGVLMERYCGWLSYNGKRGDIMSESRGKSEDMQLKKVYENIYFNGTNQRQSDLFKKVLTTKDIKIKPKHSNIAGLQLADILANPVKKKCLSEGKYCEHEKSNFSYRICDAVKNKFNKNEKTGQVWGYGKKIL